jgi:nucleotide-binding universal stress UspA family protein
MATRRESIRRRQRKALGRPKPGTKATGPKRARGFKRIVVPLDFSASSLKALDAAVELCRGDAAEIVLVHAVEPLSFVAPMEMYAPAFDLGALAKEVEKGAKQRLAQIAVELGRHHIEPRSVIRVGTPFQVIVETAKALRADLIVIVISTHGRTGLSHVLMGSVSEKVVRHAPCAVLIVRGLRKRRRSVGRRNEA